jgi:protoporphyrinogen/coproporphyrinogen III oxidase
MRETHVVIIGGGITGLSAAFALKQRADKDKLPIRCTVVEQDNRLGGKIRTFREDGLVLEAGPDSILARKPAGVGLIRDLGVESETVGTNPTAHKTYILHNGRLERLPPGTNMGIPTQIAPFATTKLLSWSGKARAVMDFVLPPVSAEGDMSLGSFLRRRVGNEVVDNIAEPLLAGIYAGSVDALSLDATFPQFRNLERKHRSLVRGSIAQRKNAPPTPAASSGRSVFVTLRDGLQTVVERLYDCLHEWATLQTETSVTAIRKLAGSTNTGQNTESSGVAYAVETQGPHGPETFIADAVIVTTPAPVAAHLLTPICSTARELSEIAYVSTATVILGYAADSIEVDLDASGFVIPRKEKRHITACTWVSSKWPHTTSGGRVLIRCYVGRAGQQEELRLDDAEMVKLVQADLQDILGIQTRPWFTRVTRWINAMPQYLVGHVERVVRVEAALLRETPGLLIAGAGYHGVGVPDCIADGKEAAQKVLGYLE